MYAIISENKVVKYPITLLQEFPNTSFSDSPTNEALNEFNVVIVKPTPFPVYDEKTQIIQEGTPINVNGEWVQNWEINLIVETENQYLFGSEIGI